MPSYQDEFFAKAQEGLLAAEAALDAGWFTVCAHTAYFAAYHAAIAALLHVGIADRKREWGHASVQSTFVEQLVVRRNIYPASVRSTLKDGLELRHRLITHARLSADDSQTPPTVEAPNFIASWHNASRINKGDNMVHREKNSIRTERAIHEITDLIQQRYPGAECMVLNRHHSSPGIWLEVYTIKDDALEIIDLTGGWLMELLLQDGVDLYVLPLPYDQRPGLKAATKSA